MNRFSRESFAIDALGLKPLTQLVELDLSGNPLKLNKRENREAILPLFNELPLLESLLLMEAALPNLVKRR